MTIRVIVVDDHPLMLAGVVARLSVEPDIDVVATAATCAATVVAVGEHQPDVLVTELEPGAGEGGARAIREVRERSNRTKTVVVSARRDMGSIDAALDAGAAAYVTKTAHPEDIASAIRQAFDQSLFLRPAFPYFRYRTPVRGLYLASASTHPGAGVHGACGLNAARQAAADAGERLA